MKFTDTEPGKHAIALVANTRPFTHADARWVVREMLIHINRLDADLQNAYRTVEKMAR